MKMNQLFAVAVGWMLTSCAGLEQQIYSDNFAYSDTNRDGELSLAEWRIYMQDRYVKTANELGYRDKSLFDQRVFLKVDGDHNGLVSKAEYNLFVSQGNSNAYFKQLPEVSPAHR